MEPSIETTTTPKPADRWTSKGVYTMASICLGAGLFVGYFVRGGQQPVIEPHDEHQHATEAPQESATPAMPSLDQMKHMAEKSAEPLQAELKQDPDNAVVLAKLAKTYFSAHQFPEAISYAQKAVQADQKHVGNRADLASYFYVAGETDKAIATLQEALKLEPNNPQVLFNLGMMKLKAKNDREGAIAAWKQLLKTNPKLPEDRRKAVEAAIANAKG